jgi:hypothetical protein
MYEDLETNFSTADAEDPTIRYDGSELIVEFTDWRERQVKLQFSGCIMFSWAEIDPEFNQAPDRIYRVTDSKWMSMESAKSESLVHWKLCFNASYFALDVLANEMSLLK